MFNAGKLLAAVLLAALLPFAGCSPLVYCQIETEVHPDYSVTRVTRMEAVPNPRHPQQRPRLGEYFQFPPAELYDSYVVQPDKVLFAGAFDSYEQIPSDLVRPTPGTAALAGNLFSHRIMDLVLFVLADFDETIVDIINGQDDGEAAVAELVRLAVPEIMSVLNAKYGAKYDLSRLDAWLNNDLPVKLRRLYAGAWAIHNAKRSGVTSPGEEREFYLFLKAEAEREGLILADFGRSDMQQENIRRLKEYAVRLAQSLCPPRQSGGAGVGKEMLSGVAMDELIASIQMTVTARHGSVNNFIAKIASLVPRAFGAYLTSSVVPIYILPETSYKFVLKTPGTVIQTNGVRELNGDLVWAFTDRDFAFTGQSMWARTIFVREPVTYSLGLRGFPANLTDVDQLFGWCLAPEGAPREAILDALRRCAAERGTAPLEALAADAQSPDSPSARGILEMFARHRASLSAKRQPAQPQQQQPPLPAVQ